MLERARILSCSTPKYTESAPLSSAACKDSKFPAGAISSILPVVVIIFVLFERGKIRDFYPYRQKSIF